VPTLQNSIDDINSWATTWQLKLAISKCQHIHIRLSRIAVFPKFSLNDNILSSYSSCRDLGIIIDYRLSFIEHINSMAAKAHMSASQILRCFLSRDPLILIRAFNIFVRPIVEYCSPVWSPTAAGQINKIESVQRWFTKRIKSLSNLAYDERLIKLGNDRLELRRLRADLLMCYKILHHSVDLHQEDFFTMSSIIITRGNSYKLIVPNYILNARANYFSVRIINVWNRLSDEMVNASSVSSFNYKLINTDLKFGLIGKP